MRGQASLETLVLFAAILLAVSSLLYLGQGTNEGQVILASARDGAENALSRLQQEHGGEARVKEVKMGKGVVEIHVMTWGLSCPENLLKEEVRGDALRFMWKAATGIFPSAVQPLLTSRGTYDVEVHVEVVSK
ncbi:MAG: hypothetical protein QW098_03810 [Candidatus Hadarchaeales archaeon]